MSAYNALDAAIHKWRKFEIVGFANEADILVGLSFSLQAGGSPLWSTHKVDADRLYGHGTPVIAPHFDLTIYDAKSGELLWSMSDVRDIAELRQSRERETVDSINDMLGMLKEEFLPPRERPCVHEDRQFRK